MCLPPPHTLAGDWSVPCFTSCSYPSCPSFLSHPAPTWRRACFLTLSSSFCNSGGFYRVKFWGQLSTPFLIYPSRQTHGFPFYLVSSLLSLFTLVSKLSQTGVWHLLCWALSTSCHSLGTPSIFRRTVDPGVRQLPRVVFLVSPSENGI